ncbi:dihydrodipicolinate synthase [uncultured Woeseiaceae bacterium]|uniref:4-hydroxy-tetrahydrodipicolinate synthase n=1 Tax=uncultured Woeseiaceae bacterium TaxID=1983305 RepID=A0A7D9D214_9GAMM|nr:dihydrodipicolinate synthase [uncultured Woeseiaceae bacterium]
MFHGSIVALVTPFDEHDRIDYDALRRLIEFHIGEGTNGLVIAGTTGESATLDIGEHAELIRRAAAMIAGRIPVIAGTGSNSTRQTVDLSLEVADAAIDGYLLVVPYYNKPVQEGLYQHFLAIADAVDKPILIYNVPGRTVADILPETLTRLSDHPNIIGVKDATGDMERMKQHRALIPEEFRYFSGDDFTSLEFLRLGGHGVVTVSGNVAPRQMSDLCRAVAEGEIEKAAEIDDSLQPLNTALFVESNPIPVKWALHEMGLISSAIRLPLTVYADEFHEQMKDAMNTAGVTTAGQQ